MRHERLFPVSSDLASALVVAGEPVDPALDQDEAELGVLVLPVPLKMLADRHGLLDKAVEILRDLRGKLYNMS